MKYLGKRSLSDLSKDEYFNYCSLRNDIDIIGFLSLIFFTFIYFVLFGNGVVFILTTTFYLIYVIFSCIKSAKQLKSRFGL
jgi:hypothetical protein